MKMKKTKICDRCKLSIKEKSESYFEIITWEKGKEEKRGYLHKRCNEEMSRQKEQNNKLAEAVLSMTPKVNQMLKQIGIEDVKNFEIQ